MASPSEPDCLGFDPNQTNESRTELDATIVPQILDATTVPEHTGNESSEHDRSSLVGEEQRGEQHNLTNICSLIASLQQLQRDSQQQLRQMQHDFQLNSQQQMRQMQHDFQLNSQQQMRQMQNDLQHHSQQQMREMQNDLQHHSQQQIREMQQQSEQSEAAIVQRLEDLTQQFQTNVLTNGGAPEVGPNAASSPIGPNEVAISVDGRLDTRVYTPASTSWPVTSTFAPSHILASDTQGCSTSSVRQPSSTQQAGYLGQMPQPTAPSVRSYSGTSWPACEPVHAPAQQQANAAFMPPPAVFYRHEQRRLFDLPPFSGAPEDWPKFFHAYRVTNETYGYNEVENLLRLQKSLTGEAARAVECLLIQPQHVAQVMETLLDTFGHPDLLICSQIERARRLPQVHEAHLEQLVPFANVVRNVATYLDGPTTQQHLSNPMLLSELVAKLPIARRVDWAVVESQIRPYATIKDFSAWVCGVARMVRKVVPTASSSKPTTTQSSAAGRIVAKPQAPKRVLLNAANVTESVKQIQCSYCDKEHDTDRCPSFKRQTTIERRRIVNERAWCYSCLRKGHILPGCDVKQKCGVDECDKWHHPILHLGGSDQQSSSNTNERHCQGEKKPTTRSRRTKDKSARPKTTGSQPRTTTSSDVPATTAQSTEGTSGDVQQERVCTVHEGAIRSNTLLFRVIPIILRANGREIHTFALFDEGSSVSLIDERLADDLGLDGPSAELSMKWFGKETTIIRSRKLTLNISGRSCPDREFAMNVRTIRNLSLPAQTVDPGTLAASNPHLRDVPFEAFCNAFPRVLIGLDNHHLGIPKEVKSNENNDGLVAVRSKLGWTVYGSDGPAFLPNARVLMIDGQRDEEYELLNELVRNFITSEDFGVRTLNKKIESDDDIRARSILQRTTRRVGDCFETGLLWRQDDVSLPPSYDMALSRLVNIEARMRRDPLFAKQYAAQIHAYLAKGYAKKLTDDELQRPENRAWYLPHFAVVNPNKPGRFRLVFDAAAKVQGLSLNSALLSGPDENMPLARLLFQFRIGEVGVCADIAEMFHQIRVRKEDQAAQRFLWRDGDSSAPPGVYSMAVMTFGATCSPAAAQHVKNVNAEEFRLEFPDAVEAIHRRHYVDDFVASFATPEEATRVSAEVVEVHRRGGFVLRGFVSNSRAVLEALGASTGPGEPVSLEPESTFEKILGMTWNTADDTFRFRTRFTRVPQGVLDGTKRPTKRIILSTSMSVFDPYGLLANFMLPPKLMVQDLYRMGLDWDEPVPNEICSRWEAWRSEISRTHLLRMPRCPFKNMDAISNLQLHIFADASEAAFAAVAFWRIERGDDVELSFVVGKVKVTPTPIQSIPRLELNAAVLATRLLDEIRRSYESVRIHQIVMWSDSETVLKWIRSDQRQYKQYVGFRVAEIAESTPMSWWRWVPTSMNVADDGTRIRNPPTFEPDGRWLWGPAWLRNKEEEWPKKRDPADQIDLTTEEVRSKYVGVTIVQPFIDYARFSSFNRLRRAVAWILRFRNNAQCQRRNITRNQGELTAIEVDNGLKTLCRIVQKEVYAHEYSILLRKKTLDRTSSIFVLNPYLDHNGLMRLYGRTDAASDEYLTHDARRPILLPRQHHFTMLMVRFHHERMAHQLTDATIAAVRQRFWVPQVRVLVRSVQQACQKCRFRTATPDVPMQGQLPLDRITPFVRPFSSTGLDYFGPVTVKIGRRHEKRWIALFTCMAVRAVHLEIAKNLSTDACLLCIRNLINLRGVPKMIRCDNGTNFIGAKNQLDKEPSFFDSDAVQRELSTRGIVWRFNRPGNPEAGGAWERLVQSIKRVLAVTLQQSTPEVETLRAHLIEAANIVNSRPLTHIPVDPEENEPITPNHFLIGGPNLTTTPDPADTQSMCSRDQWVQSREMSRQFWCRWVRDYLPELTRRSRHYPTRDPPRKGDLVILCDDGQPRSRWIRGRIVETSMGADGLIRSAKVRTADGEYWRPVTKMAVLDVSPPRIDSADGARDVAICDQPI